MTIFFYILKDFLKYVFSTLVLCIFLFVLFDFIHKSGRDFAVHKPTTEQIIQYYIFQTPMQLSQALPIAALLASVITMVLLSRSNEITAMRAAGMGPLRISMPIAIGGAALSAFSLLIGEFVVPSSAERMHYVEQVLIAGAHDEQIVDGARWIRSDELLYNFKDYDPINQTILNFKMIETGMNFRPKRSVQAEQAIYVEELLAWELRGIKILYFLPNGTLVRTEYRDSQMVEIPVEPTNLRKERRKPNELSLSELNAIVKRGQDSGTDILAYNMDMHVKFAFHFASFVVSLIGLKFAYRSERTVETARGVLIALAIGMSYWFILSSARALGRQGAIPAELAAWSANFIVFGIAMIGIWRARRAT